MTIRLSLKTKSIILVLIPIVFELGLVIVLTSQQHQAELESVQAVKARDISQHLSASTSKLYTLWQTIDTLRQSADEASYAKSFFVTYKKQILPALVSVSADYAVLESLSKDKPEFFASCEASQKAIAEIRKIVDDGQVNLDSGDVDDLKTRFQQGAKRISVLTYELARRNYELISKADRASAGLIEVSRESFRRTMLNLVLSLCTLNAPFCLLLALFFQKNIISRLNVISDNALRLAGDEVLNSEVDGDDEIADLDHIFHEMAQSMEQTSRDRQELVNMLTDDLKTPLTSIQKSLDLLNQKLPLQRNDEKKLC